MLFLLGIVSSISTIFCVTLLAICFLCRQRLKKLKHVEREGGDERISIGFFHPYCNAGGGGERVLWMAIKTLDSSRKENIRFVVYTGDTNSSPEEIITNVKDRFNISLNLRKGSTLEFIYLHRRKWVEAEKYPHFTLFGQSVGSVYLGLEALFKSVPDVYIDTMGYAFTLPLFKFLGGCRIGSYTHYPTISMDMLKKVNSRIESYNNKGIVARSSILSFIKLIYYKIFAYFYGLAGSCADIVMVNSSWTEDHINSIWRIPSKTFKVFPPVVVEEFKEIPLKSDEDEEDGEVRILSIAQFRPEKDLPLQIRSMFQLRQILKESEWERIRLILIGSCRNEGDEERVKDLQDLTRHLSLEDQIEFKVNLPFGQLKDEMGRGSIGIHTMYNEHFGIGIVESMAAGLIMIANRSGGPMLDIVMEEEDGGRNGFLASDEMEYAETIRRIIRMTPESRNLLRRQGRASVERFSEKNFSKGFLEAISSILPP